MLAADGCASSSSDPACCFCGAWAPAGRGSGGRHVRALTRLGMLICRMRALRNHIICVGLYVASGGCDPQFSFAVRSADAPAD